MKRIVILVALASTAIAFNVKPENKSSVDANNEANTKITRRKELKTKKGRSTSSSGDASSSKASSESLDMSGSDMSSSELFKVKKGIIPKSSIERTGWKKWHRKCHRCLDDMLLKWRDPRIQWICGAYQRARRSFKSECMMFYRNCQDGTMFVEIHKGRCNNDSAGEQFPHGDHFFYEYAVSLSEESKKSSGTTSEESHVLTY
ncbi:uncharacterized protein [Battus philenor]|uniref:uncharacterized protein n=1 Tax=Battus philenor TaxID=42288 RepID=UPI0035CFA7D0